MSIVCGDIEISEDPEVIQYWAKDALQNELYREDGVARAVFSGDGKIYLMAYIPGIAWSMYHDWPKGFRMSSIHGSVFVHYGWRRQGIGRQIANAAWEAWKAKGNN